MATPSNNRHKDVFAGLPRLPRSSAAQPSVLEEVPPSSISRITDSARKPPGASGLVRDSSRTKRILSNVQQTPTRGPLKFLSGPRTSSGSIPAEKIARPLHFTPGHQPATTVAGPGVSYSEGSWPSTAHKTPATNRPFCQPDQAEALGIEVTPVKLPPIALTFESPREPPPHLAPETSMSIYASLGWDDEVDELS